MGAVKRIRNVEWEKNRRERLNLTFFELSQLLPDHDPTLSLSKMEILIKSIAYIKELRKKNSSLIEEHCSDTMKSECESMEKQIADLRRRNQQLADLLRTAEISLPGHPHTTPFSPPRKWVGKISKIPSSNKPDSQQNIEKSLKESSAIKPPVKKKSTKIRKKAKINKKVNMKPANRPQSHKTDKNNKMIKTVTNVSAPLREINNTQPNPIKSTTVYPRTLTLPCTTVSLVLSSSKNHVVTVAKSNILSAPIMATGIQPVLQRNPALSSLGPGTLILPDGRIMPVPPPPPTMLATATQIIVNRPASQPAVIVMQNIPNVKPVQRTLPKPIVPKLKPKDTTKTTFVNKVPIPAISTQNRLNQMFSSNLVKNKSPQVKVNKKIAKKDNKKKIVAIKDTCKAKTLLSEARQGSENKAVVDLTKSKQPEPVKSAEIGLCEKSNNGNGKLCNKNDAIQKNSELVKKTEGKEDIIDIHKRKLSDLDTKAENNKRKKNNINLHENIESSKEEVSEISARDPNKESDTNNENSINTICTDKKMNEKRIEPGLLKTIEREPEPDNKSIAINQENIKNREKSCHTINKNNFEGNKHENILVNTGSIAADSVNDQKCTTGNFNVDAQIKSSKSNNFEIIEKKHTDNINNALVQGPTSTQVPIIPISLQNATKFTQVSTIQSSLENAKFITQVSTITSSPLQNVKSTQVSSIPVTCPDIKKNSIENKPLPIVEQNPASVDIKKSADLGKKNNAENKSVIQDDSQELSSLFPTDPKLQSCPENIFRDTDFRDRSLFMPVSHSYMDEVRLSLPHADFSNDLFSSLQVPTGGQHPESISPTAAFLLAFPLVSTSKTSELIAENEASDSQHATPTTILQIGNIDPPGNELYHQTALMVQNNVTDIQDTMKLKPADDAKNNTAKQLKEVEQFNKFQQLEMNELVRNENFSRNNCKEKKNFAGLQEQDIFLPCNKKKSISRPCDYPLPSEVISQFQDKPFEFPSDSMRHNAPQNPSIGNGRQVANMINQNKNQIPPENLMNPQNTYVPSTQSFSYNSFPSGNDFSLPNSNYLSTNRSGSEASKPSQTSSNFNSIPWSSSSVTVTTNRTDYTTPYCAYPQKPYVNSTNKTIPPKLNQTNYEDQRLKEKSTNTNNALPKFSTNFQFNTTNRANQDVHSFPMSNQSDNMNYKIDSKAKKQKTNNSQRAPVNWMTTPDVRPVLPDPNTAPVLPDVMFQPQKELDFNLATNNAMISTSSNISQFNIPSSVPNNHQTFYPNSHFSGIDLQLDFAPFPDITSSNKPPRTLTTVSNNQQNPHHYSWSPSKTSIPLLPHIDNNMIPSTLPTLVGDLALGTTTPSGPVDNFRNLSMPTTPFNVENPVKKCDSKGDTQKSNTGKSPEKDCFPNAERRHNNRNITDYCQKTHSHQSTNTTSSFLSVSQLVDHVKSEQNSSRRAGKQSVNGKNNTGIHKRNMNHQQTDKPGHTKMSNNHNNSNNYHSSNPVNNPGVVNQRKPEVHSGYQETQNTGVGYPFSNNVGPPPWHSGNSKAIGTSSHYKGGNYSAESLIGDHAGPTVQDHIAELPPFSIAHQFPNQYSHSQKPFIDAPIVTSSSYTSTEFPYQNMQPLEFHQSHHSHQNCFNFPSHNTHYSSAPFNPENEYHIGLDPLYNLSHSSSRNSTSCQTSSKDNRNMSNKRNQSSKRREEFPPQSSQFLQTSQVYSSATRPKCLPPLLQCPVTSSPTHQGTTTVANFNLSTIFPEINDKRAPPGPNTFHTGGIKHNGDSSARSSGRPDYPANFNSSLVPQMQQVGISAPPHFPPPVSFANLGPPTGNFRAQ